MLFLIDRLVTIFLKPVLLLSILLRRVLLLSVLLLLAGACDQVTDAEVDDEDPVEEGTIEINLHSANSQGKITTDFSSTGPQAMDTQEEDELTVATTHVRVVIRNYDDEDDLDVQRILDIEVPTDETHAIVVPADADYFVDAFSYREEAQIDQDFNLLLKHEQQSGVLVEPETRTEVDLVLQPLRDQFTFSLPDEIISNQEFEVELHNDRIVDMNVSDHEYEILGIHWLGVRTSVFPELDKSTGFEQDGDWSSYIIPTATFEFEGKEKLEGEDYLYFMKESVIEHHYIDEDIESLNDFRFYYPIEEYGDELLRIPFLSDEGEIDIGIVY